MASDSPTVKCIGILTSGGDAQGMNAAVRAVVRKTISMGHKAFAILNGYQGMVENKLIPLEWGSVGGVMQEGGTFIGTARCLAFMKREGRKIAAKNLLERRIDRLVIIGGDGSLTGAHYLSTEWPELVKEIVEENKLRRRQIVKDEAELRRLDAEDEYIIKHHSHLTIVGLVGSIDNDMCGTEMTIGCATALQRIVDAVDMISSTAASHQRDFIVEVMGRNCGWLALMGALSTGADWTMIPENPQPLDWKAKLWEAIRKGKEMGKRAGIVVVAEGAKDVEGKPIRSSDVKDALDSYGCEARITILGHIQRGGSPCAYDRNMSTIVGATAAETALRDGAHEACFVGILNNRIAVSPLTKCLGDTKSIVQAISCRDYTRAMNLRSPTFSEAYEALEILTRVDFSHPPDKIKKLKIGILHAGACAPGMNAAVRAIVRIGLNNGHSFVGIKNGFEGLLNDNVVEMDWMFVNGWVRQGGANLGIRRVSPSKLDYQKVAQAIAKHKFDGVIMIGGWEGYQAFIQLHKRKEEFPFLKKIPIILIPASISNNLPFSEYSIGDDTALNNIMDATDKIKQSAVSTNRVFVVEVMGSCGYLTLMSAMATGAELAYLPEDPPTLPRLQSDIDALCEAFRHKQHRGLVINNESASKVFTTNTLANLFDDQSGKLFSTRSAILGHLQQGGAPTGLDRILACSLGFHAIRYLEKESTQENPRSGCIGTVLGKVEFTPIEQLEQEMVGSNAKRPKTLWWWEYRHLLNVFGLHAVKY